MENIVQQVICETFEKGVGRWQVRKDKAQAFEIRFRVRIEEDKEGYRWLTMRIYAPMNYVAVFVREEWNVIPQTDLGFDESTGDTFIKPGRDYQEGKSEWRRVSYHDSCWCSDGVHRVLWDNRERILGLDGDPWYKVVELSPEELIEIEALL